MERILVINPGSTSTKIAVYEDETEFMSETIRHADEELKRFPWVMDQLEYRYKLILRSLENHGIKQESLTCVVSRGGLLPPVPSGALRVDRDMIDYMYAQKVDTHISNVGCVIADRFAAKNCIPAYVYDPVAVDELQPLARVTGLPELPKVSRGHALNSRAAAICCAKEIMRKPLTSAPSS
jgi:butyrate kinase